jgi:hypothetical protein
MAQRRTLGYVENEWTCPNCSTRNKGSLKTCDNCGAPQPENVRFDLGADQKLVTDAEQIKAAQAGADIHCAFCGTRNPAGATTCVQCGADLKEGKARQSGGIMQTPPAQPKTVACKNCGTQNPGSNSVCSNCGSPLPRVAQAVQAAPTPPSAGSGFTSPAPGAAKKSNTTRNLIILGSVLACLAVVCTAVIGLFFVPTASVQGTVTDVHWQTNVPVQELQPVHHTNERSSPPSDAYDVSSHTEQQCERKTIDKGNGYSEVVEECNDVTYYSYTVDEWKTVQTYTLQGNDLNPVYDDPSIASNQQLGNKSEDLTVTFSTDKGIKTYSPGSSTEYQQFVIGTTWTLQLNAVGGVMSVK